MRSAERCPGFVGSSLGSHESEHLCSLLLIRVSSISPGNQGIGIGSCSGTFLPLPVARV